MMLFIEDDELYILLIEKMIFNGVKVLRCEPGVHDGGEPLKGFSDALWKGALSGAATAGIRYLARDWDDGGSDLAGSIFGLA